MPPEILLTPPLVSVIALAYNSSKTIIETLESIHQQSHSRIELVLCDDGSIDDTKRKAEDWIKNNHQRFESVKKVFHDKNIGIVRNHHSGLSACSGQWIKTIACDDLLEENALEIFISEAGIHNSEWLFSQCQKFTSNGPNKINIGLLVSDDYVKILKNNNSNDIKKKLLLSNFLPAPGAFFSKNFLNSIGGIDLRFHHLDDRPLWLRALNKNNKPHWIETPLIKYRQSTSSVSQPQDSRAFSPFIFNDLLLFSNIYISPNLTYLHRWHNRLQDIRKIICFKYLGNKKNLLKLTIPILLVSPVAWINFILKIKSFLKNLINLTQ